MPVPTPRKDEEKDKFISRCISALREEDSERPNDQISAVCHRQWREKDSESKSLAMQVTKVQRLKNGRIRWSARANTGEFDLVQERLDETLFDDVIENFYKSKEAVTKGDAPQHPIPIVDVSHYSIFLPPEKRNMARVGWVDKMWRDGRALFARGYFDNDTRLGQLAAKAALKQSPEDRRVSVVIFPNHELVKSEGERKIYRGGDGYAWLDSLAMTSRPCDPGTMMEVVKTMDGMKDDAKQVLGDEAEDEIEKIEAAMTKTKPESAVIKGEDDGEDEIEGEPEEDPEDDEAPEDESPEEPALTMSVLVEEVLPGIGQAVDKRMESAIEELRASVSELNAKVNALAEEETKKVKSALDNDGDWFRAMYGNSVQRGKATVKGEDREPEQRHIVTKFASKYGPKQQEE